MYFLLQNVLVLFCFSKLVNSQYDWKLFWKYEFDSKKLDQNQWIVDDEPEGLCTGEYIGQDSCHRSQNVLINTEEKQLEISVTKNSKVTGSGKTYNSGKLKTTEGWTYGKFEIRAILPEGKQLRPVFRMVPKKDTYGGDWIDNGQINGLVYVQNEDFIISGIHHRKEKRTYFGTQYKTKTNLTKDFHTYSIEWMPHMINWYFDDILYFTHNVSHPFNQAFSIILQVGVGGPEFRGQKFSEDDYMKWQNNKFIIDYVKVFKNASEISDLMGNSNSIVISKWFVVIFNLTIVFTINILLT